MARISVDIVNSIRTNLRDRYKNDLAIIKEFIQNADDAGASCLDIEWLPQPTPTDAHELFCGPAIIILNNAELTPKDASTICRMGINFKSSDSSSIGKFCYALKTVFHLCEAFFFVASGEAEVHEGNKTYKRKDILSPWFDEDSYDDYPFKYWEKTFSKRSYDYIESYVKQLPVSEYSETKHWFCIWIPLRT